MASVPATGQMLEGVTAEGTGDTSTELLDNGQAHSPPPIRTVENGIEVKHKGKPQLLEQFPYRLAGLSPPLPDRGIGWRIVALQRAYLRAQHIRCHQLQPEDDLADLVATYASKEAIAVIIIDYEGSDVFQDVQPKSDVPVVVLSPSQGHNFHSIIRPAMGDKILCRIRDSSQLTFSPEPALPKRFTRMESASLPDSLADETPSPSDPLKMVRRKLFLPGKDKQQQSPTEDPTLFAEIMSLLVKHELNLTSAESSQEAAKLFLSKIVKKINEESAKEFPFYIILCSHAIEKRGRMYHDEDKVYNKLAVKFMELLETLDLQTIVDILTGFLQRENFEVEYLCDFGARPQSQNLTVKPMGVFNLLERGCATLLRYLCSSKKPPGLISVYRRMLLISIRLKVCSEIHPLKTSEEAKMWTTYVVEGIHNVDMGDALTLKHLKAGLQLGLLLELPKEAVFDARHMSEFYIGRKHHQTVRPLQQLRKFVETVEEYIPNEQEFASNILCYARSTYNSMLIRKPDLHEELTGTGTELIAVKEGLEFLEYIISLKTKRKWNTEFYMAECSKWLRLLVMLVDPTSLNANNCYRKILYHQHDFCQENEQIISEQIVESVRKEMKNLDVNCFAPLYESLCIWDNEVLEEYFCTFNSGKFKTSLRHDGWKVLIGTFVQRYSDPKHHRMILEFFKNSVQLWYDQQREEEVSFVLDLLQFDTPYLFRESGQASPTLQVAQDFTSFLTTYIQDKHLQVPLLDRVQDVLSAIAKSEGHHFQDLVLSVLWKTIAPELLNLQSERNVKLLASLTKIVGYIIMSDSYQHPTVVEAFCWNIIQLLCGELPSSLFDIHPYLLLIENIGHLYKRYRDIKKDGQKDLLSPMEFVDKTSPSNVQEYFKWVSRVHDSLRKWKVRFEEHQVTVKDIHNYKQHHEDLCAVAEHLGATSLLADWSYLERFEQSLEKLKDDLTKLLLFPVKDAPEMWLDLDSLLRPYEISISNDMAESIQKCITFPTRTSLDGNATRKTFRQHPQVTLCNTCTLLDLTSLEDRLRTFVGPLLTCRGKDALVFFTVSSSVLFNRHIMVRLNRLQQEDKTPPSSSLSMLQEALCETEKLIREIISGSATYGALTADENIELRELDVESEFQILEKSQRILCVQVSSRDGLSGVKSILELLKCAHHVRLLEKVLRLCKLDVCLKDLNLREICSLAKDLESMERRMSLTTQEATIALDKMKKTLCVPDGVSSDCLNYLNTIEQSQEFLDFLVGRRFVGPPGLRQFRLQSEIITQLQHSDYDEHVLNQLTGAFKFISPFVACRLEEADDAQFHRLMSRLMMQDLVNGPKQLDTVNRNVHLIQLWFSQIEGDTRQNIKKDLECVMKTGEFVFQANASDGYTIRLTLQFEASSSDSSPDPHIHHAFHVEWNSEQISSFLTQLGFHDHGEDPEMDQQIDTFLHVNEIACRLSDVLSSQKELGMDIELHPLSCQTAPTEASQRVDSAMMELTQWKSEIEKLRDSCPLLLFFSIPKAILLYQLLCEDPCSRSTNMITSEVCFLLPVASDKTHKNSHMLKQLKSEVEIAHQNVWKQLQLKESGTHSLAAVCKFLEGLSMVKPVWEPTELHRYEQSERLYSIPGYSQDELVRVVLSEYDPKMPQAFQIMRCRPSTTEAELNLFMSRVRKFPSVYVMLGVDLLPFDMQEVLVKLHMQAHHSFSPSNQSTIIYIETQPSSLRDIPWLHHQQLDVSVHEHSMGPLEARKKIHGIISNCQDNVLLCFGYPGDGKSHFIKNHMQSTCDFSTCIPVHEGFTAKKGIEKLRTLSSDATDDERILGVHFNITISPFWSHGNTSEEYKANSKKLFDTLGWFIFDFLLLGYAEDPQSGLSFRMQSGITWNIYIEVPSSGSLDEDFTAITETLPLLDHLGAPLCIHKSNELDLSPEIQLVCKYLYAYKHKSIDQLVCEVPARTKRRRIMTRKARDETFPIEVRLDSQQCRDLLESSMPDHVKISKTAQKLFIWYMRRRCEFLENLPLLKRNILTHSGSKRYAPKQDTSPRLGTTLFEMMLEEVNAFTNPKARDSWSESIKQQLIYTVSEDGTEGEIGVIFTKRETFLEEHCDMLKKMGVKIPSEVEDLFSHEYLEKCLAQSLCIPEDQCHKLIEESQYILTHDYTMKMLNIHERRECGVPVIIEGETGVGKTALVEMLSKLWNYSVIGKGAQFQTQLLSYLSKQIQECGEPGSLKGQCMNTLRDINAKRPTREDVALVLNQQVMTLEGTYIPLSDAVRVFLQHNRGWVLLQPNLEIVNRPFQALLEEHNHEATVQLVQAILSSEVRKTFYKLPLHAGLSLEDITDFFQGVFETAEAFLEHLEGTADQAVPSVIVFLDEINTVCYGGLLKEIITDQTMDGKPIPTNVFVIGACNPHRGNSLALSDSVTSWIKGSYYVKQLHPTLQFLKWDYGSLSQAQEKQYVKVKLSKMDDEMPNLEMCCLSDLISESQECIRGFVFKYYVESGLIGGVAHTFSKSCVSQRDIQRVFTLYSWIMKVYKAVRPHNDRSEEDCRRRALLVALGTVYYLRLPPSFREHYEKKVDTTISTEIKFAEAFQAELDWYIDNVELPDGIAKTQALRENLFAVIVCACTRTPLLVVGKPGSSKTLSFHIAANNLSGAESPKRPFQNTAVFPSLDPYFYQCSRHTLAHEINTVFSKAIKRQKSHASFGLPISCVVFMDEAGLPPESQQSLKALHHHLDQPQVSFVAISNHVLDAAKTNRAVCIVRPETTQEELEILASGCLKSSHRDSCGRHKVSDLLKLCPVYMRLMNDSKKLHFFGLRDFIHLFHYIRHHSYEQLPVTDLVLRGLERNFNGTTDFPSLCRDFLVSFLDKGQTLHSKQRSVLTVLQESLNDHPCDLKAHSEVRYKLIVDPSEDDSLIRHLFKFGVLQKEKTYTYVCSDLMSDSEIDKINTIAAICQSAIQGHTVILDQTEDIHESFYDLFNLRFRWIDDSMGTTQFYTNVASGAHIKPCRVHEGFQCLVLLKETEIPDTPSPFLNRFEKFRITHNSILAAALNKLPEGFRAIVGTCIEKVTEFVNLLGGRESFFGFREETIPSLVLSFLPGVVETHESMHLGISSLEESCSSAGAFLFNGVLRIIQHSGFLPLPVPCDSQEYEMDMQGLFQVVERNGTLKDILPGMSQRVALQGINEALQTIHEHSSSDDSSALSTPACLVISLLHQYIVRYLCKRLMQLMTPEALVSNQKKLPLSYIENYLLNQKHFNLKDLLVKCYNLAEAYPGRSPTKVMVYTRSSPLIHELHSAYLSMHQSNSQKPLDTLHELIYPRVEALTVLKISGALLKRQLTEILKGFYQATDKEVLIVSVNMQDTSKKAINHLRIVIEEAESHSRCAITKVVAILLHFPTSMFPHGCYPCLFLNGWDHHYLDSVSHRMMDRTIDIEQLFFRCCSPNLQSTSLEASLQATLTRFLPEAACVLASRSQFRFPRRYFNTVAYTSHRRAKFEELLFSDKARVILCNRFLSYLSPQILGDYLQQGARLAQARNSSSNITSVVESMLKGQFFHFLAHVVFVLDCNQIFDINLDPKCNPTTHELFLQILDVMPLPDFANLSLPLKHNQHLPIPRCRFPFYRLISLAIEEVLHTSIQAISELSPLGDEDETSPSSVICVNEQDLQVVLERRIRHDILSEGRRPLFLALVTTNLTEHLSRQYFEDLTSEKLDLQFLTDGMEPDTLQGIFDQLNPDMPPSSHSSVVVAEWVPEEGSSFIGPFSEIGHKILSHHVSFYIHHQHFTAIAPVLRQLNELQNLLSKFGPPAQSVMLNLLPLIAQPEVLCGHMCELLFEFLKNASSDIDNSQGLIQWYKFYATVMSKEAISESLHKHLSTEAESKLNVMHVFYLILACDVHSHHMRRRAQAVYLTLYNKFFQEVETGDHHISRLHNPQATVRLPDVAEKAMDSFEAPTEEYSGDHVKHILQGLLKHFFSRHKKYFHKSDVEWFLKMSNKMNQWKSNISVTAQSNAVNESQYVVCQISKGVLEFYLRQILATRDQSGAPPPYNPVVKLHRCNTEHWSYAVGKELLANYTVDADGLEPYTPEHYSPYIQVRTSASLEVPMMNQQLAHLYFCIAFEKIWKRNARLSSLLNTMKNMDEKLRHNESTTLPEKVLLNIEWQAVMQVAVSKLCEGLCMNDEFTLQLVEDIKPYLNDPSRGASGHGPVFAMHLLGHLRSLRLYQQRIRLHSKQIRCLQPLCGEHLPWTNFHLFPFLWPEYQGSPLATLYNDLRETMTAIHMNNQSIDKEQLWSIMPRSWNNGSVEFTWNGVVRLEKIGCFRMMVWLCVYYEFYEKGIKSYSLAEALKRIPATIIDEAYLPLFEYVLYPDILKHKGGHVLQQDSLHEIFHPTQVPDPVTVNIRRAMANLVAAVLATPHQSTHLWYHMFKPEDLCNTHMTAFMMNSGLVSPNEGIFYNRGVELTKDGFYGRRSYLQAAGDRQLNLPSLYPLLWVNFAAFGIALLTQEDAEEHLLQLLCTEKSVRLDCFDTIFSLWRVMEDNCSLLQEELAFFLMVTMLRVIEFSSVICKEHLYGKLKSNSQLMQYETLWHRQVLVPAHEILQHKFRPCSKIQERNWEILHEIRCVEVLYPTASSIVEPLYILNTRPDTQEAFQLLYRFLLEYPRLEVAGSLLPKLVTFYRWLHRELAHRLTKEAATKLTLRRFCSRVRSQFPKDKAKQFESLYSEIGDLADKYIRLSGAVHDIPSDCSSSSFSSGRFPVIQLLSMDDQSAPSSGGDWLYKLIDDMITSHNCMLRLHGSSPALICPIVNPLEIVASDCIVSSGTNGCGVMLQQIVHRRRKREERAVESDVAPTVLSNWKHSLLFEWNGLHDDIVAEYLQGKPLIDAAVGIRVNFCFKKRFPGEDIEEALQRIPSDFQMAVDEAAIRFEFHSAELELLQEIVGGLTTVVYHLLRALSQHKGAGSQTSTELRTQSLANFLASCYKSCTDTRALFREVGLTSLTEPQLSVLGEVKLYSLCSLLRFFICRSQEGAHDFCDLPFVVKAHMAKEDQHALYSIQSSDCYSGHHAELMRDLKLFESLLIHLQPQIREMLEEKHAMKPLISYIKEENQLLRHNLIPKTILVQHYVDFRLTIRRLTVKVQEMTCTEEELEAKWVEAIDEPWAKGLPYVMAAAADVHYSPTPISYGFPTGDAMPSHPLDFDRLSTSSSVTHVSFYESEFLSVTDVDVEMQPGFAALGPILPLQEREQATLSISNILHNVNLQQYTENFEEAEVTESSLGEVDDSLLRSIGVDSGLHRLKILIEIRRVVNSRSGLNRDVQSTANVTEFLASIGMAEYGRTFEEHNIDGQVLLEATDHMLKEIGITRATHRANILVSFKKHVQGETYHSLEYPVEKVIEIIKSLKFKPDDVSKYCDAVQQNQIDGEILKDATEELKRELGMKELHYRSIKRRLT